MGSLTAGYHAGGVVQSGELAKYAIVLRYPGDSKYQSVGDMDIQSEVIAILQSTLGLPEGSISPNPSTRILGVIPEMDSMSVVGVLTALEEQYGIIVDDDEVDADVFATVGSLSTFVESKVL